MAMTIVETPRFAANLLLATDTHQLEAGKNLKIETSPQGEELFNREVPVGKTWEVHVTVQIVETDV